MPDCDPDIRAFHAGEIRSAPAAKIRGRKPEMGCAVLFIRYIELQDGQWKRRFDTISEKNAIRMELKWYEVRVLDPSNTTIFDQVWRFTNENRTCYFLLCFGVMNNRTSRQFSSPSSRDETLLFGVAPRHELCEKLVPEEQDL